MRQLPVLKWKVSFCFLTSADVSAAKLCDSEASYGLVPDNGEQVGDDGAHNTPSASSFCNLPSYVSSSFRLAMEEIFWHPVPLLSRNRQPLADQGSELVLPRDMLSEDDSFAYLKIIKPKTRYRGGGRVQHLSVQDSEAVAFLDAVFGAL